jgi:small-conductance mechanosensitive channel
MTRKGMPHLAFLAAAWTAIGTHEAMAQGAPGFGMQGSMMGQMLRVLTDRIDQIFSSLPTIGAYFATLPQLFTWRDAVLLIGIVVAGLAAEWLTRIAVQRMRARAFARHAQVSPMRAFYRAALLDALALLALWLAARWILRHVGPPQSVPGMVGHELLLGLLYWRSFNFVFRIWLRPNTDEGRIAPVDGPTAQRLLIAMNAVIVLPLLLRQLVMFLRDTGATQAELSAIAILAVPLVGAGLVYAVWHWRHDMGAWLAGMVNPKQTFAPMKLSFAQNWWVGGLVFYVLSGLAAVVAAATESAEAMHGIARVESLLILLLLFETLIHRLTQHLPFEVPTVTDAVAACARLGMRLIVLVVAADAILLDALSIMAPSEWEPHARAIRIAAISAFVVYAFWRFAKYRMDRYIADNPLPSAGFDPNADDDAPSSASRLRTIMPLVRVTIAITILMLGGLLVLSQLGVNITPLIAGFSVLGLAVSFGSQSLVRDIVSGIFFLAEDSFRVGEYIDGTKVKGTVEGFSVRSLRLRHQNGQLHIVPFGQLTHITNFSRDWTTVKFNLAFGLNTDVELLRKTVKKIGLDMMTEPQFEKELLQPLKMQGLVDIKDASLIVRFKFTAKPKNPSMIQRMAIRRMYDSLPKLGIEFARPPYAQFGYGGLDPAARAAAQ